ncbi:MAG: thermonuclease family protein [Nanoarchaeota archaeon]
MKWKRVGVFILIIIILGITSFYYPYFVGDKIKVDYSSEKAYVVRIIDGDTIETSAGVIRFLGINTPEKGQNYSQEATDFLKQIEYQQVNLVRDFEDLDKYKRKLRYVVYNDRIFNIEIAEKGLGKAYMTNDLIYTDKIINAQIFAQENCLGLWKQELEKCK